MRFNRVNQLKFIFIFKIIEFVTFTKFVYISSLDFLSVNSLYIFFISTKKSKLINSKSMLSLILRLLLFFISTNLRSLEMSLRAYKKKNDVSHILKNSNYLLSIIDVLIKEISNIRINELKLINKYFVAKKLKIIIFMLKN